VRVINVEVVVTDRAGRRVTGLQPDDFRLLVDGVEAPIEYFSEIREGVAEPRQAADDALPDAAPPGAVGTNFLVYVDDNRMRKTERDLAIEAMIEDLALLPATAPNDARRSPCPSARAARRSDRPNRPVRARRSRIRALSARASRAADRPTGR
jgi:hypothetical protein